MQRLKLSAWIMTQVLEHLAELRGEEEEVSLTEFPKEDLAKYLSPADLHVLEDPRESPSRYRSSLDWISRSIQLLVLKRFVL